MFRIEFAFFCLILVCQTWHGALNANEMMSESIADDSVILTRSRNITVNSNETVQLRCDVNKSPNTVVIWNQCEDPSCNNLRSPLTISKDNFIDDLRFRILSESIQDQNASLRNSEKLRLMLKSGGSGGGDDMKGAHHHRHHGSHHHQHSRHHHREHDTRSTVPLDRISSWTLEIRKFGKDDEACYQCQLSSMKSPSIHYCIKLKTEVIAPQKRVTVYQYDNINLNCFTESYVKLKYIKWYKDGHKLREDTHPGVMIENKATSAATQTRLHIRRAMLSDAGNYTCLLGKHMRESIVVHVIPNDRIKSSEIRSNPEGHDMIDAAHESPSLYAETAYSSSSSSSSSASFLAINGLLATSILVLFVSLAITSFQAT